MARLGRGVLANIGLRLNLLQATWNFERQQGLGWAFAIAPALRVLIPDRAERCARLADETAYFNTQPTLASLAAGAVVALAERRATGYGPDDATLARVKAVLGSSLAALGDRLFWFTLRPLAAVTGVLLVLSRPESPAGAIVLWAMYAGVHLFVRFAGVGWGYAAGPAVMGEALRRRFEALVVALCWLGCMVLGVATAFALSPGGTPRPLPQQAALVAGLGLGLLSARRARPSPTQWALGLGLLCVLAAWSRP